MIAAKENLGKDDLEDKLPDEAQRQAAQKVRHKEDGSEYAGSFGNFRHHHGQGQRDHVDHDDSDQGKLNGVYESCKEFRVFKGVDVVLYADESLEGVVTPCKVSASPR